MTIIICTRRGIGFLVFVNFLFLFQLAKANFQNTLRDGEIFDFIVVGGGTAGCVIAGRLSESGRHKVLLIHEGGIPHPNLEVPALSNYNTIVQEFPNEMKFYQSVPQQNSGLANKGIIQYNIGKAMGGGSSVNGMMWNRGHPKDYDNWARLTNDKSWSYENLLKYFQKSEDYAGFNPTNQRGYYGPVTIRNAPDAPALKEILQAGQEIGYPIGDPNGPQTPSINLVDFSQNRKGRRVSSYSGYIRPLLEIGKRINLFVLLNTEAKRIIFEGRKAVGVTYLMKNSSKTGYALVGKEIIISAGVMDSPAILIRSGIGPEDLLMKAKIPVIKNLPVGRNLQDHLAVMTPVIYGNRSAAVVPSRDLTSEAWKLFEETARGPYSVYSGIGAQGFFQSSLQLSSLEENWPDIHLIAQSSEVNSTADVKDLRDWEVIVNWGPILVRPRSRGSVTINAENVDGPPLIDFQYLSHPDDMKVMLDAVKITQNMCERTAAMQSIGCRFPSTPIQECSHLKFRSETYWECYIKQRTTSGLHAVGTCRMGSGPEDPEAVVDSQLKVIGVDGLRVVDASVIAAVPNANTQTPVYVIAEKTAELILDELDEV